jgi:acyl-CoA synthetase (AMP-forming)/AMP-acid ligase II
MNTEVRSDRQCSGADTVLNTGWNFADIFGAIARHNPDACAIIDARGTRSWGEFDRRTDAFAHELVTAGLAPQAKVAVFQRNCAEYLESYLACMKAGLVPVNVNYRYGPTELTYLFTDADVEAVIAHREFLSLVEQIRPDLPLLRHIYVIEDDTPAGSDPAGVLGYEAAIRTHLGTSGMVLAHRRHPKDLLLIYTGGTTGLPKGVMWQQHELFEALVVSGQQALNLPPVRTIDDLLAGLPEQPPRGLSASPLMHSTGLLNQFMVLLTGGCAVMLPGRHFDAAVLWATVAQNAVTSLAIVGDAFARPMLAYLEDNPGQLDLSALQLIVSSGAMWSRPVQEGLLRHLPGVTLYDAFGSSEGFGLGMSSLSAAGGRETAHFKLGPNVRVRTDDGDWVGTGEEGIGRVGVCGALPLGYYKDPAKTDAAFPVIDGVRYSIAGDYVQVFADGSLQLMGRGSACINTGGEKVYAEEVEEVLKEHPGIRDAACVGVPHPRFGSAVCAVIEVRDGAVVTGAVVTAFVRSRLASYKAPREVVITPLLPRTALGKVDYPAAIRLVLADTSRT